MGRIEDLRELGMRRSQVNEENHFKLVGVLKRHHGLDEGYLAPIVSAIPQVVGFPKVYNLVNLLGKYRGL